MCITILINNTYIGDENEVARGEAEIGKDVCVTTMTI